MKNKICVYTIAKNEIKFIDRWYHSVKTADYVCVLDTGSTDGTWEKLQELDVICAQKVYENFRFDVARNDSMQLIPADANICVCVDIDEVFEDGWTDILKQSWTENTTQAQYRYTWNFNPDGSEGYVFMLEKIHKNGLFHWTHPVHETLEKNYEFEDHMIELKNVQLNHHADPSKSRASYLPLLILAVKENPDNDRNLHYLGREYMFAGEFDKAIETLKRHLELPNSQWAQERCSSHRYIAKCYEHKKDKKNQEKHLILSLIEDNTNREPYYDLGVYYFNAKQYEKAIVFFSEMLKISSRTLSYISSPECWNYSAYDYLSLAYFYIGNYEKAIINVDLAISMNNQTRLKENKQIFVRKYVLQVSKNQSKF